MTKTLVVFDLEEVELGYYFFQLREKSHLTIKELSKTAGVSKSSISLFECGHVVPSTRNILKLCKVLKCELKFCLEK